MSKTGRPLKYKILIERLLDDRVYSAAMIAHLVRTVDGHDKKHKATRVRKTLNMFTRNNGFPEEGDGGVKIQGQGPSRGWFGWRWKEAVNKH